MTDIGYMAPCNTSFHSNQQRVACIVSDFTATVQDPHVIKLIAT